MRGILVLLLLASPLFACDPADIGAQATIRMQSRNRRADLRISRGMELERDLKEIKSLAREYQNQELLAREHNYLATDLSSAVADAWAENSDELHALQTKYLMAHSLRRGDQIIGEIGQAIEMHITIERFLRLFEYYLAALVTEENEIILASRSEVIQAFRLTRSRLQTEGMFQYPRFLQQSELRARRRVQNRLLTLAERSVIHHYTSRADQEGVLAQRDADPYILVMIQLDGGIR